MANEILPNIRKIADTSSLSVFVTHAVLKSNDVHLFVVPASKKAEFDELTVKTQNCQKNALSMPTAAGFCVAEYCNTWARGVCVPVDKSRYKVYFMDYGNTEIIGEAQVKQMPSDLLAYDTQCVHCVMRGKFDSGRFDVTKLLAEWLVDKYFLHIRATSKTGVPLVDLLNGKKESVNNVCMISGTNADGVSPTPEQEVREVCATANDRKMRDQLASYKCSVGDELVVNPYKVLSAADSGGIGRDVIHGVVMPTDAAVIGHYDAMNDKMEQQYSVEGGTGAGYQPVVGELVASVFEGHWYRGVCEGVDKAGSTATIRYTEYGNVDGRVAWTQVRPLSTDYMTLPTLLIHFTLDGVGSGQPIGTLTDRYTNNAIIVVTGKGDKGVYPVKLYSKDRKHCLNDDISKRGAKKSEPRSDAAVAGVSNGASSDVDSGYPSSRCSSSNSNRPASSVSSHVDASPTSTAMPASSAPVVTQPAGGLLVPTLDAAVAAQGGGSRGIRQDILEINQLMALAMAKLKQLEAKIG